MAALTRQLYGPALGGSGFLSTPKYYARVTPVRLAPRRDNARDKVIRARFTDVFERTWLRLEYFFFYVYNNAWNQHQPQRPPVPRDA